MSSTVITRPVTLLDGGEKREHRLNLIQEEPLAIRVQGQPYAVVMRTPGDETAHAAGFALAEGILDSPDEIETVASCAGEATNVVTITVTAARLPAITGVLDRRGFVSQTSCGICGKELVEDLSQMVRPLPDGPPIDLARASHLLETLKDHQKLYQETRASHAAALYSLDFALLSLAEDVGRHNALDKAIGKLFLERSLHRAAVLILSSRISYELVQKAARAKIPLILAASRPTALAVELAESLNMTLASPSKEDGIYLYCGGNRLTR
jgi:FdhD protein